MKQFITLFALLIAFATTSFAQAEQTLVKSISTEGMTAALVDLPGEITTSHWDKDQIRLTAVIKVTNSSETILKRLVMVGRYDITSTVEEGKLMIAMPKVANTVIIKGVNLEEIISFELQLPYEVSPEFTGKSIAPQAM